MTVEQSLVRGALWNVRLAEVENEGAQVIDDESGGHFDHPCEHLLLFSGLVCGRAALEFEDFKLMLDLKQASRTWCIDGHKFRLDSLVIA